MIRIFARDPRNVRVEVVVLAPVGLDPLRVRLEAPPLVALQQGLADADLSGTCEPVGILPGMRAVRLTGRPVGILPGDVRPALTHQLRRVTVGLRSGADLPDAARAVIVAGRTAQHARPEHQALLVLPVAAQDPFVVGLADQRRHAWRPGDRFRQRVYGHRDALGLYGAVRAGQQLQVDDRRVVDQPLDESRVDRHRMIVGVDRMQIARDVRPACASLRGEPLLVPPIDAILHVGVLHMDRLSGHAPHHRIGSVPSDEIPVVPLHHLLAGVLDEVAPGADDARHQSAGDQPVDTAIRQVEIGRIQARIVLLPREAGLVGTARVEREHVGIEARDDQDAENPLSTRSSVSVSNPAGQVSRFVRPIHQVSASQKNGVPSRCRRCVRSGLTVSGPCRSRGLSP